MIQFERKWVSGRDRLLDYINSQLMKGGSWDFRIEEDDIISDGYYVTSTPIVPEKPVKTVKTLRFSQDEQEVDVMVDGCFHNSKEAYYILQSSRSGDCL